jgi:hypothetical protein
MHRKLPTDLEIFNEIYDKYYDEFKNFTRETPTRRVKNHVPIDIDAIARQLGVDGDIVFGRLYYLHCRWYNYTEEKEDGRVIQVPFFDLSICGERHPIHFPMMAAILSDLRKEHKMHKHTLWTAVAALVVSIFGVVASVIISLWLGEEAHLP